MASRATAYRPVRPAVGRASVRFDAQVTRATMRGLAQPPVAAAIAEISIYGCRIACDVAHEVEEPVWLRLNGSLPIAARVVWSEGGMIGCRFDVPIGRPLLRSLTISGA
jgi:hypothetical protein